MVIPDNVILIPPAEHVIKDSDILLLPGNEENLEKIKKMK
jgi:uncharacterized protein with PhoU and TrkA domain